MKRIVCIAVTVFVMVSTIVSTVGAVSYSDLEPTYSLTSDKGYYTNSSDSSDDNLQRRANCYGYALRLHYGEKSFKGALDYRLIPRELYDKSGNDQTYNDLLMFYHYTNPNVIGTSILFANVNADCQELGYTITPLCANPTTGYIPPASSQEPTKRLIAIVSGTFHYVDNGLIYPYNDFHFYMQNEDGRWSHKRGTLAPQTTCGEHSDVQLTDSNISQHLNCAGYNSSVTILFYIDAPGYVDKAHANGTNAGSYKTEILPCDNAGNVPKMAAPLPNISQLNKAGSIDHKNDVDFYYFDVSTSGNYGISLYTATDHNIYTQFGEVVTATKVSYIESYRTSNNGNLSFVKYLAAGKRYCLRIYSTNQTEYEDDRDYWFYIERD